VIVDSSALLAVIFSEEDEPRYSAALLDAPVLRMSAANWVEAAIVVDSCKHPGVAIRFDDLFDVLRLKVESVTVEDAYRARAAYCDYGKGHHPARLNYGDCFAYALSKRHGEPLLFKGKDFSQTDIEPALKD
jgi:ribonuclease VapC